MCRYRDMCTYRAKRDNPTSRSLAVNAKRLRIERKLSQMQLALDSGIDMRYYADFERGYRAIGVEVASKIADGLGVTLSELFCGV